MSKKIILIVICSIIALGLLASGVFVKRVEVSQDIAKWNDLEKRLTYLPSVAEMGNFSELEFKYQHKRGFFMDSEAYILKVNYSEKSFQKHVDNFLNDYSFQESVVNFGEKTAKKETDFQFDDFKFKMLSLKEYDLHYPKQIAFIGVSEKYNEIAVVYYSDIELDYIEDSFEEFLVEECGWEYLQGMS